DHPSGAQLDLGLIPRHDLAPGERVAQLLLVTQSPLDRLAQLDVEDLDAIAAALLRSVLRGVRVREQCLRIVGRVEIRRDADARADVESTAGNRERRRERGGD